MKQVETCKQGRRSDQTGISTSDNFLQNIIYPTLILKVTFIG